MVGRQIPCLFGRGPQVVLDRLVDVDVDQVEDQARGVGQFRPAPVHQGPLLGDVEDQPQDDEHQQKDSAEDGLGLSGDAAGK